MRRRAGAAARLVGGALVLAVVVAWVGPGAFLDGVRGLGPGTLLAALAIGAVTTVCSAWRWRVVAGVLGVGLPLSAATAACYRSQFLNSTLPGGVVGDVHRGVRHGLDAGDLGAGVRAVVWERAAGQVVQAAVTGALLLALPSPVRGAVPGVVLAGAGAGVVLWLLGRGVARRAPGRAARALRAAAADGRVLARPPARRPVVLASLLALAGHVTLFAVAARAAGVSAPLPRLVPLALVVLLAAAVPLNVAGWGPREGAAAAVFAAAGPGAAAGAATAAAFGVLALVSVLPGAVVQLAGRRRPPPVPRRADLPRREPPAGPAPAAVPAGIPENGAPHG